MINEYTAHGLLDIVSILLLGTALFSVLVKRFVTSVRLLAAQGVLLTAVALIVAALTTSGHAYTTIAVTLIFKAIIVPGVLLYALRELKVKREVEVVISNRLSLVLAVGLVLVARYAVWEVTEVSGFLSTSALSTAVAMLLIGFLNMLIRKKALSEVIGIVAMENGLYLMAVVGTQGLPLAVELGVAVDVVVGVLIMGLAARQIQQSFDTTNTDYLTTLRG